MQLKREAKLLTVIGLNTKHADLKVTSPAIVGLIVLLHSLNLQKCLKKIFDIYNQHDVVLAA